MKNQLQLALVLLTFGSIAVSAKGAEQSDNKQFNELLRINKACASLYEVADMLGNWRRFTRGYNFWTREPEWHTEKLGPRQAVAKVLKKDYLPAETGRFSNKQKEFEARFKQLIVEPCNTLTGLQGELQSFIETDLTEEKYQFLIELCKQLSSKAQIEELYKEFRKEIKITYEAPIKGMQ